MGSLGLRPLEGWGFRGIAEFRMLLGVEGLGSFLCLPPMGVSQKAGLQGLEVLCAVSERDHEKYSGL